jgi:hypothetical protein
VEVPDGSPDEEEPGFPAREDALDRGDPDQQGRARPHRQRLAPGRPGSGTEHPEEAHGRDAVHPRRRAAHDPEGGQDQGRRRDPEEGFLTVRLDPASAALYALVALCLVMVGAILTLGPVSVEQRGAVLGGIVVVLFTVSRLGRRRGPKDDDDEVI